MNRRDLLSGTLLAGASGSQAATREGLSVESSRMLLAAEPIEAARAGLAAARDGGNAMDAASAACVAACMLEPHLVDLGGYVACAVVYEARTGKVWALDANSAAPQAARDGMYKVLPLRSGPAGINEREYKCSVADNANVDGPLAVGVPGTLAGIGMLWEKWGRLKWPQVLAPARALLDRGFPVSEGVAAAVALKAPVIRRLHAAAEHLMPGGKPLKAGQVWHRPDMEKTLTRLASAGWQDFYQGDLGRRIADHVSQSGGVLSRKDMSEYAPRLTPALERPFGKARVYSALLPNGGLTCISALLMLDALNLPASTDPMYWHLFAETLKLAWRDRLRYFGDPAKAKVDWELLANASYNTGRSETLRQFPNRVDLLSGPAPKPSPGTIHISTGDHEGNLVAITISHGGSFGSSVTVPETGVTLGHGMCRFDPHPGLPNSVASGKRPLNNVCPTILVLPDRRFALGLRGGRRIVSANLGLILQVAQGAMSFEAVEAPRIHNEGYEPVEISRNFPDAARMELEKMGHRLAVTEYIGHANIVSFRNGVLQGGSNVWCSGLS